jgi:predicted  nucleic acid-binding Zn-ribbon protein
MLFSNLVATLRADLDAIRDDLGEFVTTVKTDTSAMLGLAKDGNGEPTFSKDSGAGSNNVGKHLEWEEMLWENPDLLCENPSGADWDSFVLSNPVNDEEVEALLSNGASEIVSELYRELVPSRVTHADFFQRLFFHKNRMNQAARARMQGLVMDEEETRWEDDDLEDIASSAQPVTDNTPQPQDTEEEKISREAPNNDAELASYKSELTRCRRDIEQLRSQVEQLTNALRLSEEQKTELKHKLDELSALPHKKVAESTKVVEPVPQESRPESSVTPPSASWEKLPSQITSSNEEPVVVMHKSSEEEEEEDEWE